MDNTRGIIAIHSAPAALRPHLEWAIGAVFAHPIELDGTGAQLTSALKACVRARFEVTEEASASGAGNRWAYTPSLGLFSATIGEHGDIMIHEDRLKQALLADALGRRSLAEGVADLLGARWDDELEVFRQAGAGQPVRWLHKVG